MHAACRYADVIIPWQRGDNIVAIDLITEHIRTKLQQHSLKRLYPNLEVIASNYQVGGRLEGSSVPHGVQGLVGRGSGIR